MPDPLSDTDRKFLHRAVRLAMNGRGNVEPNPMVGCIIVRNGAIIGEGFHQQFGGPHAEPNALAACKESPAGATAYVTLEPCCHSSKKTPPCVPALIAAGVARVVVGCIDPNPSVAGQGIAQLRDAGIQVDEANDAAARQLIAPYVTRTVHHRPYITLKWAQSADGKVAGPGGLRVQISNKRSQHIIHALRARSDAILIGIGTAVADNPLLTARDLSAGVPLGSAFSSNAGNEVPRRAGSGGEETRLIGIPQNRRPEQSLETNHAAVRPLIRMVLDSDLRLSIDSQLVRTIDRGKVVIFCSKEAADYSGTRTPLAACGVEIHAVPSDSPGRLNLPAVIAEIGKMNVTHLIVEPGPTLAGSFLTSGVWDRAWVIQSPKVIGDAGAPAAPKMRGNAVASVDLEGDELREYLNPAGANAGDFASADVVTCSGQMID